MTTTCRASATTPRTSNTCAAFTAGLTEGVTDGDTRTTAGGSSAEPPPNTFDNTNTPNATVPITTVTSTATAYPNQTLPDPFFTPGSSQSTEPNPRPNAEPPPHPTKHGPGEGALYT